MLSGALSDKLAYVRDYQPGGLNTDQIAVDAERQPAGSHPSLTETASGITTIP